MINLNTTSLTIPDKTDQLVFEDGITTVCQEFASILTSIYVANGFAVKYKITQGVNSKQPHYLKDLLIDKLRETAQKLQFETHEGKTTENTDISVHVRIMDSRDVGVYHKDGVVVGVFNRCGLVAGFKLAPSDTTRLVPDPVFSVLSAPSAIIELYNTIKRKHTGCNVHIKLTRRGIVGKPLALVSDGSTIPLKQWTKIVRKTNDIHLSIFNSGLTGMIEVSANVCDDENKSKIVELAYVFRIDQ